MTSKDKDMLFESEEYLTTQVLTYLGNKRTLLDFIGQSVNDVRTLLKKEKIIIADMFSGSGIVSRYFKQFSKKLICNDLEEYTYTLNKCYLANKSEINIDKLNSIYNYLISEISKGLRTGIISRHYAPKDTNNIKAGERCFYTTRNAMYLDTMRQLINELPNEYQHFFIAPLLTEASIKNNTAGIFRGFYKNTKTGIGQFGGDGENALSRIKKDIKLPFPVFSNFNTEVEIYTYDANKLAERLELVDLAYLDPPYNQHPYGSNYFMLNVINEYKEPKNISIVSGIPKDWNRSKYNIKKKALKTFENLCNNIKAKYLLISFNSDGFIDKGDMLEMLSNIGKVKIQERKYNTFKGSRNLNNRDIHVKEYLYLVEVFKYN